MKLLVAAAEHLTTSGLAGASVLDDVRSDLTVAFVERADSVRAHLGDGRSPIQGCPAANNIVIGTWKQGMVIE